ncbi:hypothetical protein [Budvicia aquatica]|uniref:Uncharacterized protein n=1 Tax=Budvicia aquatica TaxID=82979 RepID=A0A2C6CYI0_9GAMM|nr:hypothetical protein [Budvicia aquatica]PHI31739.1 hypothetical protein CRN84_21610 [Budvicia aquatica]
MTYYFGDLKIEKTDSFSNVASLLSDVLGVHFYKDENFTFDEILAYMADTAEFEYILYCVPDEEASFYDDISYYHLEVRSTNKGMGGVRKNISSEIKNKIDKCNKLKCEVMKAPERLIE